MLASWQEASEMQGRSIALSPWLRKARSLWHRMRCQQTRLCKVSTDPSGRHTPQAIGRHTLHSMALSLKPRKRYYLTRVWATTARVWQQLRLEWTEGDLSATPRHCAYACHVSGLSGPEEICSCRATGPQGIFFFANL